MSARCFVDTNILIYAHDHSAGVKHRLAKSLIEFLWDSGAGVLSTQVLQELCINLRRKTAHPPSLGEVRRIIHDYLSWEVVVNSPESILRALDFEARYKISFWDALIIQSAASSGATILYSEDLAHGQRYGPLRLVNPFLEPFSK
jgi:predicted nucleic acid-binding protein